MTGNERNTHGRLPFHHHMMAQLVRQQLLTMARYNVWATSRLLGAVDALSDDKYHRDVGLFFKSIHGTLNHIVVAEHDVWYTRIHDRVFPRGLSLDKEAAGDRHELKRMLVHKAERWLPVLEALAADELAGDFNYSDLSGSSRRLPFMSVLAHVFNHGTHHRGHVTAALTMLGHASPEIDLVYMLQEEQA